MRERPSSLWRAWRRFATAAIVGLLLVVPSIAHAEGDLEIVSDATYRIEPDEARLEVTVAFDLTNNVPSTSSGGIITQYYYDRFAVLLPDEAVDIVATQGNDSRPLTLTDEVMEIDDDGTEARVLTMRFRQRIYYRGSTRITLAFAIPGGEPRTESAVRVNPAYAAFPAWAWGDAFKSKVSIVVPSHFDVQIGGELLTRETQDDGTTLWYRESVPDPSDWGVFVAARNDDALFVENLAVDDLQVSVRSWPGDQEWAERVADVVARGLPELQSIVGLTFGDQNRLEVLEALDPSLTGYAGWYLTDSDQIEMGEYLDDHVIIHEMAHLWFDSSLFVERWITEGLADEYASRVVEAIDGESDEAYRKVRRPIRSRAVAVPLTQWRIPTGIPADDDDVANREEYGYNASYYVMRVIMKEIGTEGMSAVLNAARDDLIAYRGSGDPETVPAADDWRRFIDLLEELGGSTEAQAVFREFVLTNPQIAVLDEREATRTVYREVVAAAGAWDIPFALRDPMSQWRFVDATAALELARTTIETRDATAEVLEPLALVPPDSVRLAYESATDAPELEESVTLAAAQLDAATAVADARAATDAPRSFFSRVGLIGQDPETEYRQAADAFEADDLPGALAESAELRSLIRDAEGVGKGRVIWASAGLGVLLVAGAGGTWLLIRRRSTRGTERPVSVDPEIEVGGPTSTDE